MLRRSDWKSSMPLSNDALGGVHSPEVWLFYIIKELNSKYLIIPEVVHSLPSSFH